jgi:hypothetical protein
MELEYKIVQSTLPTIFSNRRKLETLLAEEARAGWQLVEKFDNFRIRMQRDISHRANDDKLDFDAYRCHVGVPTVVTHSIAALVTMAAVYGIFLLVGAI